MYWNEYIVSLSLSLSLLEPIHVMYWNYFWSPEPLNASRLEPIHVMYWNSLPCLSSHLYSAWTDTCDVLKSFIRKTVAVLVSLNRYMWCIEIYLCFDNNPRAVNLNRYMWCIEILAFIIFWRVSSAWTDTCDVLKSKHRCTHWFTTILEPIHVMYWNSFNWSLLP